MFPSSSLWIFVYVWFVGREIEGEGDREKGESVFVFVLDGATCAFLVQGCNIDAKLEHPTLSASIFPYFTPLACLVNIWWVFYQKVDYVDF